MLLTTYRANYQLLPLSKKSYPSQKKEKEKKSSVSVKLIDQSQAENCKFIYIFFLWWSSWHEWIWILMHTIYNSWKADYRAAAWFAVPLWMNILRYCAAITNHQIVLSTLVVFASEA